MRRDRERASYRVEYPVQERPLLVLAESTAAPLPVHDLSERGVGFTPDSELGMAVGDRVSGVIRFGGRGEQAIHGEVVWIQGQSAAIRLDEPIPFGTLVSEQNYLRSRYRHRSD